MEAIARGSVRPQRLILWLADAEVVAHPPAPLARLVERGLEIRHAADWGPHKKYYPYACSQADHELPLVTAETMCSTARPGWRNYWPFTRPILMR
ncbi:hypothetical protein [Kocuria aegyptia]|uniref:hypothetical protein n=1 Tax=Kocuria aegyptia TaxID=330943 RepID=UPI0031E0DC4D